MDISDDKGIEMPQEVYKEVNRAWNRIIIQMKHCVIVTQILDHCY